MVVLAGRIDCRSRQAARGPSRPEAKSLWITMDGSSPTARERRRGERASEAGSSVAKPRDRWRAPSKPVGSRQRVDLGAPVEGRRFGSGKSSPLTRGRRKRSWFLESVRVEQARKASGRDRERQRSDVSLAHGRKRQAGVAPPEQRRCPDLHLAERRTEPCTDRPKLEARRQARAQPGSDCRKAVRRRTEEPDSSARGRGEASCDQRSASYVPGSRAVHGCSCRGSVAEVGERHLLRAIEGSREANRGCTE